MRYSGQGRKSLAGAGRSPRILAVRQFRRQAYSEPNQASRTACALPPPGAPRTQQEQNASFALLGSREEIPCGCRAEPANPCRQAIPPSGVLRTQPSKPNGLRPCRQTVVASVQYSPACVISPFVAYLPPCPVLFFLSGIPRCRKRRGENANPRTNFIFCKKQRIFWHVCAGQGRDNGSNAAKERRKTFGRGTGMERCEPEPKPAKSIYKAKMKDAHHKTVKFIQKIENRAPGIPGARAIV